MPTTTETKVYCTVHIGHETSQNTEQYILNVNAKAAI